MKLNDLFRIVYQPVQEGSRLFYFTRQVEYCCSQMVYDVDGDRVIIASIVSGEPNAFRVSLNHVWVRACPYCKAGIVCVYEQFSDVVPRLVQEL